LQETTPLQSPIRFADYELDPRVGELRNADVTLQLHKQPLRLLLLLLEHPGEVVTRESLHAALWPDHTFVDFDDGLNHAVRRLREALGDSAENPRFIETLPRLGYRFICPLGAQAVPTSSVRLESSESSRRRWTVAATVGVALALLALLFTLKVGFRDRLLTAFHLNGAARPRIESIAVLPFENLSGDPAQEYFADGMTEELITNLAEVSALRVISRTSVMRYKGAKEPLPEIARQLNVDAVVEGTVLRSGDRVRVTVNLLQAKTDRHLWAETYEDNLREVLDLQADVARAIAREIKIKVATQEDAWLSKSRRVDPEAYRLYLQGSHELLQESESGQQKALGDFEQAIKRDPSYAPAYAGLSMAYQEMGGWHGSLPFSAFHTQARDAASKALELDGTLASAYMALGRVEFYEWNWAGADRELRRAIELQPSDPFTRILFANYLTYMGRFEESIAVGRHTVEIDPLSADAQVELGYTYQIAGRLPAAFDQYKKAGELNPRFALQRLCLAGLYLQNGMADEGAGRLRETESLMANARPPMWLGWLAFGYARAGRRGDAFRLLRELKMRAKAGYVPPTALAYAYVGLGENAKALHLLQRAYENRDIALVRLKVDWRYDSLRSDPRFRDILLHMNFPP
jgi:TolB-like protein/DNA-binding winged helix-turn-helix (wHTH) protein/Tfp pilus assembly protein PilF